MSFWVRNLQIQDIYSRWNSFPMQRISPGRTLFRAFVSIHVVGDAFCPNEPLFIGVKYIQSTNPFEAPGDPFDIQFGLAGDWVRAEMHAPRRDPAIGAEPYRNVWPADGHLLWDIQTNRKPTGNKYLLPFVVWGLPQNSAGLCEARMYYSLLTG